MVSQTTASRAYTHRAPVRTVFLACLAPILLLAAMTYVAQWKEIGIGWLLHDPSSLSSLGRLPFYAGFITKVGVVLWVVAASVSLFSYAVLDSSRRRVEAARFLLASGILSGILGMDDFFTFHETIAPRVLGIPELVVLASYGLAVAAIALRLRRFVQSAGDGLLGGAMTCFAASLVVDLFFQEAARPLSRYYLLEEGFKFVGISLWACFHVRVALGLLRPISREPTPIGSVSSSAVLS